MAKLQPLLNRCKFLMKCIFVLSFYNALYCKFLYVPLCWVFTNRVTISTLQTGNPRESTQNREFLLFTLITGTEQHENTA